MIELNTQPNPGGTEDGMDEKNILKQKLDAMRKKYKKKMSLGIFDVGDIIELGGMKFEISTIGKTHMMLRLLPADQII